MKEKIIEVKNITKKFGKNTANKNVSFDIHEGERVAIIGGNGAGKTTLVEQLIGVSKPTSGKIIYNFEYTKSPQERMGMQFQDSSYPEGLTVKDVIDFSMNIYGAEIDDKIFNSLLKTFQVEDFYKAKAKRLSGGQQQKLNVLLAIVHNPKIVILDEISTGLDIEAREEIISYVDAFIKKNKTTTILISHHMSEIEKLCSRIIFLKEGQVIAQETIADIKKKYKSLSAFTKKMIVGGEK